MAMAMASRGNNDTNPLQNVSKTFMNKILSKVQSNKLTIVVGPTGCGKSSLVPQILLDHYKIKEKGVILCTQPRRLAVVAVASHVARQRDGVLGAEVGYHVGQDNVSSKHGHGDGEGLGQGLGQPTKLLFVTAGILLEELKMNGLQTLETYPLIIIDECHERSCESDLCLAILKELMHSHPKCNIRLVLMSATFQHEKYTDYFRGVPGCEYVDTITMQTAESIDAFYEDVETLYLNYVEWFLKVEMKQFTGGFEGYFEGYFEAMRRNPLGELMGNGNGGGGGGKSLSQELLILILFLVLCQNRKEAEKESEIDGGGTGTGIFLIFAPTYRHLEQIYNILTSGMSMANNGGLDSDFDVDVLHSSLDIEDCLKSMQGSTRTGSSGGGRNKRKILLASAIADSSVTIPGVTLVIDTCRALEVKWDATRSQYNARTTYASQTICDQRRGRTGRTCPGRVIRLVPESYFINELEKWEQPHLEFASCRDEVLSLVSSHHKVMSNPVGLLNKCLDPPEETSVYAAIQYLKDIGACEEVYASGTSRSKRQKLVPTEYGRLISTLPFQVEEAGVILHGAKHGLLHEALILVAIKSTRPHPIVQDFGETNANGNQVNLARFYDAVEVKNPKSIAIAHFSAYLFWYVNWNGIRREAMQQHFQNCAISQEGVRAQRYNNHESLLGGHADLNVDAFDCNISDWTPEMDQAHGDWCKEHFINPSSVRNITQYVESTLKTLYRANFEPEWLKCQPAEPTWNQDRRMVFQNRFGRYDVFSAVYGSRKGKEISANSLIQVQEQALSKRNETGSDAEMACIHFLAGNCKYGDYCKNAHSYDAPKPLCRFYFRGGGCTNRSCLYSHTEEISTNDDEDIMVEPIYGQYVGGSYGWYSENHDVLLLLGEGDFSFRNALHYEDLPPAIASTVDKSLPASFILDNQNDITGVDATRFHVNENLAYNPMNSYITKCAWNFPSAGQGSSDEANVILLRGFLMSAASYFKKKATTTIADYEVGLALQGSEFSKWDVMSSAQNAGFVLEWWHHFDASSFDDYNPRHSNGDRMKLSNARFYVFRLKKISNSVVSRKTPSRMIELPDHAKFGIELEMSSPDYMSSDIIADHLSSIGIIVNVVPGWSEGKKTSKIWKIVPDSSIMCNRNQPDCNQFELVSPILQAENGLNDTGKLLQKIAGFKSIKVNKSMGFHVHVDVSKYSLQQIIKICQQFVKYEDAIDLIMPKSRRTGSDESNAFFKSNTSCAKMHLGFVGGDSDWKVMRFLNGCQDIHQVADVMNPDGRYFKLNLQNLKDGRQPTIEFRQHSSTINTDKVRAWVRFCVRFCENSANFDPPTPFANRLVDADSKFDYLFQSVIKDNALHRFYRDRKKLLVVDNDGDACCYDCVVGNGCSSK